MQDVSFSDTCLNKLGDKYNLQFALRSKFMQSQIKTRLIMSAQHLSKKCRHFFLLLKH